MPNVNGMRWIKDNTFEPRYNFWTRANVSEVLPDPPSPLGWDLVWEGAAVAGWRDLFVDRCGILDDELDPNRCETIGIFGGYAYLGAAFFRVWASRTPGMEATSIDDAYFGSHPDVPPYVAEPWHENQATTDVMARWLEWATVGLDQNEREEDFRVSLQLRSARPDFASLSEPELIEYAVALRPLFRRMFNQHINQSLGASIGPALLAQVCAVIGRPEIAMELMTGLGGVDSAAPSYAMWELSRTVRSSAALEQLFAEGTTKLYDAMSSSTNAEIASFKLSIDDFLREFGSRGPNEWDLYSSTWELNPAAPLAAIGRMRLADDSASPLVENASREKRRHELEREVREALADDAEALATFEVAIASTASFLPGRERSKTTIIRVIQEARMALCELGRSLVERDVLGNPRQVFMFFVDELDDLIAGRIEGVTDLVERRAQHRQWLSEIEPPFIINGEPTPVDSWPKRLSGSYAAVAVGDTITGVSGCPGQAQGRARVVLDPTDPGALQPGEILIAPMTDPSWTPLFVAAAAVVVDVGAALSHAVIVSRELGIPCVPSALDATKRIPTGALLSVDGITGTVTVLELPT